MSNNEYVEKLYKKYDELVKICNFNNLFGTDVDDILQELFIILLQHKNIDRYASENEPNMYIIFAIIKNLIYHYRNKKNKIIESYTLIDEIGVYDYTDENEDADRYEFVLSEINKIDYWFDREIITLYITYKHTIRSLSRETKISFSTIQPIIHNFKNQVKYNWKEKSKR